MVKYDIIQNLSCRISLERNLLLSIIHVRTRVPNSKVFEVDALELQSLGSTFGSFLTKYSNGIYCLE